MQLIFQSLIPLFTSTVIIPTVFYFFAFTLAQFPTANPSRPISLWFWNQPTRLTWLMVLLHAIVCWCKLGFFFCCLHFSITPLKPRPRNGYQRLLPVPVGGLMHISYTSPTATHNHNSFPSTASQASLFVPAPYLGVSHTHARIFRPVIRILKVLLSPGSVFACFRTQPFANPATHDGTGPCTETDWTWTKSSTRWCKI